MPFTVDETKLTLRESKGAELSWIEADNNVKALRDALNQLGIPFSGDGTLDPNFLRDVVLNYLATSFISSTYSFITPVGNMIGLPKALSDGAANPVSGSVWVKCDGAWVLKTDYPKLYDYLAESFNAMAPADGQDPVSAQSTVTHFRVPDMRGRILVGSGGAIAELAVGGLKTVALALNEMPAHRHLIANGDTSSVAPGPNNFLSKNNNDGTWGYALGASATEPTLLKTSSVGSDPAVKHENMPPYLAGHHYILAGYKVNGNWV